MAKYTEGPWEVWTDEANDGTPYIKIYQRTLDGEHITICTMGVSDGEVWGGYVGEEEDARLIAAAPAMRDALLGIINTCKLGCNAESNCGTCFSAISALVSAGVNLEDVLSS